MKKKFIVMVLPTLWLMNISTAASATKPVCSNITLDQAINAVKDDYYHKRIERWTNDLTLLGTSKPQLNFDKSKVQITDVFLLPFTAKGEKSSKEYFAIYQCKNGEIEYSSK